VLACIDEEEEGLKKGCVEEKVHMYDEPRRRKGKRGCVVVGSRGLEIITLYIREERVLFSLYINDRIRPAPTNILTLIIQQCTKSKRTTMEGPILVALVTHTAYMRSYSLS
jgi:hypothetical protein